MTWRELDEAASRWASALIDLGARPGNRVASLMPNRVDLIVHYLGCLRAGLVAVPLNYRYTGHQIDHALSICEASVLLVHQERSLDVTASDRVQELPLGCVWYGETADQEPTFDRLVNHASTNRASDPVRASDPAFIFFTSGSTGPAKGVTHTHETLGWMAASAAAGFEMTPDDRFLPASSMSHLGAILWSLSALSVGVPVIVAHTFDGDEILPLIREHRPTLMAMIPAALIALVRDHGATGDDFVSVRVCRAGADHVPSELEVEFLELTGLHIDEGYGMSEVGLASLNPPSGLIKPGSIGTAVPGVSISIVDRDGGEVPAETVGEVLINTCGATIGYWNDPETTKDLMHCGWVQSGDLARVDDEGYLWFFGRRKQVIVHDGSNISPTEVEDSLSLHPSVALAGVVGVHDVVHGENVRAYVTLNEGVPRPTDQELIRYSRERVGYRAPEEIIVLDEIPLNPTGKIDRKRLKEMAQDHVNPYRQ